MWPTDFKPKNPYFLNLNYDLNQTILILYAYTFECSCRGIDDIGVGGDTFSQITLPAATTFSSIAAGTFEYAALTSEGQAYRWIGSAGSAVELALPSGFSAVAADLGEFYMCFVGLDDTVRCGPSWSTFDVVPLL